MNPHAQVSGDHARRPFPSCCIQLGLLTLLATLLASPGISQTAVTANRSSDVLQRPARAVTALSTDSIVGSTQRQELVMQWDGTAEDFYAVVGTLPGEAAEFIQLLTMPSDSGTINTVTACFGFDVAVTDFTFEVLVLRNSGGLPTTVLADEQFELPGVTSQDLCIAATLDLPVAQRRIFVGVRFPEIPGATQGSAGVFLGADQNGPSTSPSFARVHPDDPWETIQSFGFPDFRNLAIELEFTSEGEPPPPPLETCPAVACIEDDETLCLLNDRFQVKADFRDIAGASGPAKAGAEITPDTGFFHFPGQPNNVEVTTKLIDACGPFDRLWFFAAGMTDQEFTLKVCDTETGALRTYFDPLDKIFTTITDTSAFATCP